MNNDLVAWALFNGPPDEGQRWLLVELCKIAEDLHVPFAFNRTAFIKKINGDYKECSTAFNSLVHRGYIYVISRATKEHDSVILLKKPVERMRGKKVPTELPSKVDKKGGYSTQFSYENWKARDAGATREASPNDHRLSPGTIELGQRKIREIRHGKPDGEA